MALRVIFFLNFDRSDFEIYLVFDQILCQRLLGSKLNSDRWKNPSDFVLNCTNSTNFKRLEMSETSQVC